MLLKIPFSTLFTVKSNFKNDKNLHGKNTVKVQSCTKTPSVGQNFKQVYFDPSDVDKFALCLSKYFNGPDDVIDWSPKYWCLIGRFQQVKILKAKTIEELNGDLKWQWKYRVLAYFWPGKLTYLSSDFFTLVLAPPKFRRTPGTIKTANYSIKLQMEDS